MGEFQTFAIEIAKITKLDTLEDSSLLILKERHHIQFNLESIHKDELRSCSGKQSRGRMEQWISIGISCPHPSFKNCFDSYSWNNLHKNNVNKVGIWAGHQSIFKKGIARS